MTVEIMVIDLALKNTPRNLKESPIKGKYIKNHLVSGQETQSSKQLHSDPAPNIGFTFKDLNNFIHGTYSTLVLSGSVPPCSLFHYQCSGYFPKLPISCTNIP